MVDCWNLTTATLLGDGSANMGLAPGTLPAVAVAEDIQLEVAQPAAVSTVGRGYRNSDNGTIVKFVAYGLAKEPDSMGSWCCGSTRGRRRRLLRHGRVQLYVVTAGRRRHRPAGRAVPGAGDAHEEWPSTIATDGGAT